MIGKTAVSTVWVNINHSIAHTLPTAKPHRTCGNVWYWRYTLKHNKGNYKAKSDKKNTLVKIKIFWQYFPWVCLMIKQIITAKQETLNLGVRICKNPGNYPYKKTYIHPKISWNFWWSCSNCQALWNSVVPRFRGNSWNLWRIAELRSNHVILSRASL